MESLPDQTGEEPRNEKVSEQSFVLAVDKIMPQCSA